MKRRISSIILALAVLLSLLPVTAWAVEAEVDEAAETEIFPDDGEEIISPGDAEAPETAMEEVQALIDALPSAEDVAAMDPDGQRAAYDQTQTAYDAYLELTEEQRGLIDGAWVFEELFAVFNGQIMPLAFTGAESGTGTADNPYQISTLEQFKAFRDYVNGGGGSGEYFRLTQDIDLQGSETNPWTPISSFGGTFHGRDHVITGLYINNRSSDQGLFGEVKAGGTVEHLGVSGSVTGYSYVGGIAGRNYGTVAHCYNTCAVSATNSSYGYTGGVVGFSTGPVTYCYNAGTVSSAGSIVGGVVGANRSELKYCYNIGSVQGSHWLGGVAAAVDGDAGTLVSDCYNTGTVTATGTDGSVGGIAGRMYSPVTNCYNFGIVAASGSANGSICGDIKGGSITRCYYLEDTYTSSGSGSQRKSKDEFSQQSTFQNWDFNNVWKMDNTLGRPVLQDVQERVLLNYEIPDNLELETTYGTPASTTYELSRYFKNYANGESSAGNLTYSVPVGLPNGITATLSGSSLAVSVAAGTNAGEYPVTAVAREKTPQYYPYPYAIGSGAGEFRITVTVKVSQKSIGKITVEVAEDNYTYNGQKIEPKVTVKDSSDSKVILPDEYIVTYSNNTNAGTATVSVTDKAGGNYIVPNGSAEFDIDKADQDTPEEEITVTKSSESIIVTNPVDSKYQYNVGAGGIDESKWTDNAEFSNLDPEVPYTVYVRLKEDGNHYASQAETKTVTTAKADGSATVQTGETLATGNGSVTNDGENITVQDQSGNTTTTVTPVPGGGAEVDENGSVTVPQDGVVRTGDGPKMTLPGGGTVSSGGGVTADEIVVGDTTVQGSGVKADKDGNITVSEGDKVKTGNGPEMTVGEKGGSVDKNGNVTLPENGSVGIGDATVTAPKGGGTIEPDDDGGVNLPGGSTVEIGDTTVTVPEKGGKVKSDGDSVTVPENSKVKTGENDPEMTLPEGGSVKNDGSVTADEIEVGGTTAKKGGGGGKVTADGNGSVTVPEGGTVTPKSGPEMTLPDGGTVDSEGKVTADEIEVGGTTAKKGSGSDKVTADENGSVTVPEGGTVTPESGPEMTLPDGGTMDPADGSVTPNEGGSVQMGDDITVTVTEDGTLKPDGKGGVELPGGGGVQIGETTVKVPENGTIEPDASGGAKVSDGSTVTPPGGPDITVGEQGGTVDENGNVELPGGGSAQVGETTVTVPEGGGTLEPSGEDSVKVPSGSTVTPPGGPNITVDGDAAVDEDGNVTLPEGGNVQVGETTVTVPEGGGTLKPDRKGGVTLPEGSSVEIGDTTVNVPEGGTITPNEDGSVDLPAGSTVVDKEGNEHTVPPQGGKLDSEGNYEANDVPSKPSTPGTPSTPSGGGSSSSGSSVKPSATDPSTGHIPESEYSPSSAFSDLDSNAWYYEAADYVISNGLMNGYGDGNFGPNDTLSRAMLAQILYNVAGNVPVNYLMQYDDVPTDAWYTEAVRWAVSEGIVTGYGSDVFGSNDPITREQLAAMLYRYAQSQGDGFTGDEISLLDYTDADGISNYANEAVAWCVVNGILNGYSDGTLRPQGQATRAEAAIMLMNFLSRLEEK